MYSMFASIQSHHLPVVKEHEPMFKNKMLLTILDVQALSKQMQPTVQ